MAIATLPDTRSALRFGTRADYGVIVNDEFYGVHQPYDGYPQWLGAQLLNESAEISDGGMSNWDTIAENMVSKSWVVRDDVQAVQDGLVSKSAIPAHPDGEHEHDLFNLSFMVPRKSNSTLLSKMKDANIPALSSLRVQPQLMASPSFRQLAEMRTATKTKRPFVGGPSPWSVIADLDAEEISIWDGRSPEKTSPFGTPYAMAHLEDVQGMKELAGLLSERFNNSGPPRLPYKFKNIPAVQHRTIFDGMWKRPAGFHPLPGEPIDFEQSRFEIEPALMTGMLCGAPTLKGSKCRHNRPAQPGGVCPAGHVRGA